ncbi:hypothetical protein Thivi_1385 [Thiocystis violascens DSM 198]|uniref:Uncharacterized protein n=1 Tax=Thiocystis violascens (strain ATCC 17096 / DSM 198 / 6111) TaxID=765911 RepID=I3Y8S5_THIV6|nr:hypothetical protein Thivi_1385 [Thiocystis violascens DSM 198]
MALGRSCAIHGARRSAWSSLTSAGCRGLTAFPTQDPVATAAVSASARTKRERPASGHGFLVAFSCKGRGMCPSCNTRRMAQTAAHLLDHVFPLFVNLTTDEGQRANMAIAFGGNQLERGHPLMVFLNDRGYFSAPGPRPASSATSRRPWRGSWLMGPRSSTVRRAVGALIHFPQRGSLHRPNGVRYASLGQRPGSLIPIHFKP